MKTSIHEFAINSPIITLAIIYVIAGFVFKMWNRFMRHLNIRSQGWPPAHCNADGDFESDTDFSETAD